MILTKNIHTFCKTSPVSTIIKRCYPKIDPVSVDKLNDNEVEFHSKLAEQWWDPLKNPLHALNEIRVPFIRNCLLNSTLICSTNTSLNAALTGLKVLDVGCGGGILSEALARLNCKVTGVDASSRLIEVAKEHAKRDKNVEKNVTYENANLSDFSEKHEEEFDVVVVSEVLEHVMNKERFLSYCIQCLKNEGSIFFTTPNKTKISKYLLVDLAEFIRIVPAGTHDFSKFITPRELALLLKTLNCTTRHIEGIMFSPITRKFRTSWYQVFMYALHGIKNTRLKGIDFEKERNKLYVPD